MLMLTCGDYPHIATIEQIRTMASDCYPELLAWRAAKRFHNQISTTDEKLIARPMLERAYRKLFNATLTIAK